MHALSLWFIRNPVAANLLMALILIGGWLTAQGLRIEGFPRVPADTVVVTAAWPGAQAEQVDQQVTTQLLKALEGLPGVKRNTATSHDGYAEIRVQKAGKADLDTLQRQIQQQLDGVDGLPAAVERPLITRNAFTLSALIVQLYGDTDPATLQRVAAGVRQSLLGLPEVSKLNSWGEERTEIHIQLNPELLEQYQLDSAQVAQAIRAQSRDTPLGDMRSGGGRTLLRLDSLGRSNAAIAALPVVTRADGSQLLLGELADIERGPAESDVTVRYNGEPALGFEVKIAQRDNVIETAAAVRALLRELQPSLPQGLRLDLWADTSGYIDERLTLLRDNAVQGLLLVFALLALFLNLRLAFWVALGIPIAVAGALAAMGSTWIDYSLNDITTFGLIIALGILVDDAVVVGESVYETRRDYPDPIDGTARGLARVSTATVYGVLTTVAAFAPMLLLDNPLGKVLAGFSGVVILALLFSLLESKLILPAHLAATALGATALGTPARPSPPARAFAAVQGVAKGALRRFNTRVYAPALRTCLVHRYAALLVFVTAATLGLAQVANGRIATVFFPEVPGQLIAVQLEMDRRAPLDLTLRNVEQIDAAAARVNAELQGKHQLPEPPVARILRVVEGAGGAIFYAELSPSAERPGLSTPAVARAWRETTGALEGATELRFDATETVGGGFALELAAEDTETLRRASEAALSRLRQRPGVLSAEGALDGGDPQVRIRLRPQAAALGFSSAALAAQVGERFGGSVVQRIADGGRELKLRLRDRARDREGLSSLMQARVRSESGQWHRLMDVATLHTSYSSGEIRRREGRQVNTIYARLDSRETSVDTLSARFAANELPALAREFPSVRFRLAGAAEEMGELRGGLLRALLFTAILIYVLLAVPLRSYTQPLIILAVVPFGFVGAAVGHLIVDLPLSLLSFFGMLALTGIVVNDSLVMITRFNQSRDEGAPLDEALNDAGVGRFQAIFLTTATTVAGLLPLLRETSEQAQYLIPAAVSLAWGEIFATAITLLLVPVLLAIAADIRQGWLWHGEAQADEPEAVGDRPT